MSRRYGGTLVLCVALATIICSGRLYAEDKAQTEVPGAGLSKADSLSFEATGYFRYGYLIQDSNVEGDGESEPHNNSFEMTRFYFGARSQVNSWLSMRFTADVGSESSSKVDVNGANIEIPGSQRYELYVKYAWIQAEVAKDMVVRAGIIDNPYNEFTDKFWGYRYTFKNVGDEEKLWDSADLGLYFRYSLPDGLGDVTLGVVNGSGYKTFLDKDENKDLWLCATITPLKALGGIAANFKVGGYLDYVLPLDDEATERVFFSGFAGYQDNYVSIGYQFLADDVTAAGAEDSVGGIGHGLYVRGDTPWGIGVLGRFALYDKDTDSDSVATKYQALAGLSYAPAKLFQISASGLATWYSDVEGTERETELTFLLSTQFQY